MQQLISLATWLILGAVAGWLAGIIMKSQKSLFWNIVLGVLGSVVGGFVASLLGIGGSGLVFEMLVAVGGACLVIFIARKIK